jgi:hypothetical protein
MTQNQIAYHNAKEVQRHNLATEAELNRHQLVQEQLSKWANSLNEYSIAVNKAHYERMDAETARANKTRESLSGQTLSETTRSNVASERIKAQANQIQAASVAETSRHQQAMEDIQRTLNDSIIERNYADVGYTEEKAASEGVYRTYILPSQADLNKSNADLNREKTQTEYTNRFSNIMSGFGSGARAIHDLGGLAVDLLTFGAGKSSTNADWSRNFWNALEVQTSK